MSDKKELALQFSGGTDSTYTATLVYQRYERVHLVTYDKLGLLNIKNAEKNASLLKDKFGQDRFIHRIINIDRLVRKISYNDYLRDVFKYRFFLLLNCGLCKLAMHWQTIIYCLDNNIKEVCDGSNEEMADPGQNEKFLKDMKLLYDEFGIIYFNPIFKESRYVRQKAVFDLGLSPVQYPKWTRFSWEKQPFCTQDHLNFKFINYARTNLKGQYVREKADKYESKMLKYLREKRNFIREQVYRYLKEKEIKKGYAKSI